ncbi:MAG: unspecific monooxygenase [Candidatus Azotimanducaceae bacterium]|jgi:unspecific monooxygenase
MSNLESELIEAGKVFRCAPSDSAFFQNPYPVYDKMRALGPCFYWQDYGHWCFSGFDDVNALLRDRRFGRQISHLDPVSEASKSSDEMSAIDKFEANSLLELEPPVHTRLRRLVNRAFVSRQVESQRVRIEKLANELIDQMLEAGDETNLLTSYAEVIPIVVICELLGVDTKMAGQLLDWSHEMVAIYAHGSDDKTREAANIATEAFQNFIEEQVALKRKSPQDDLLSGLIRAEEEGEKLSLDELSATCILLLNAGHEATVHGIGNAVKSLLEEEVDTRFWFENQTRTRAIVEESLRFDSPLHMFTRYVLEDLSFGGQSFKQGDIVGLMLGSANRDDRKFSNPHQFDPERGGIGQVSFGAGIHFCVGAPLARLELEVALPVLFEKLPNLRLASKPSYADRYHFHGLERLDLTW